MIGLCFLPAPEKLKPGFKARRGMWLQMSLATYHGIKRLNNTLLFPHFPLWEGSPPEAPVYILLGVLGKARTCRVGSLNVVCT